MPPFTKRTHTRKSNAGVTALKEVRKLKKQVEVKMLDTTANDNTLAGAGLVSNIFAPGTGDTDTTHVGDKVSVKSISMRVKLKALEGATSVRNDGYVRIIVLYIKTITASNPAVAAILSSGSPVSLYTQDTSVNYRIVSDTTHYLVNGSTADDVHLAGGRPSALIKKDFSFKTPLLWDNDGTQIKGRFIQIAYHDLVDESVILEAKYRFRYTDM